MDTQVNTATQQPVLPASGCDPKVTVSIREGLSDLAIETLRAEMVFFRDKAERLCDEVIRLLKTQNASGLAVSMMYKHMTEARKIAIDTAAKLAPYQSPKLQTIEVKKETTHKYVIEAPSATMNEDQWLQNTQKELKLLDQIKKKNQAEEAEVINQ